MQMSSQNSINSSTSTTDVDDRNIIPLPEKNTEVVFNLIGNYGYWQFVWTFILSLYQTICTFHLFAFAFQSADKDYWCSRPNNMPDMNITIWKKLSQPKGPCSILDLNFSNMTQYNIDEYLLLSNQYQNDNTNMTMSTCKSFEYSSHMGFTLVQEFNLVCDQKNLVSMVEVCFLAGAAVASLSSGWISDTFGRKYTLMILATVQFFIGTIIAFSTSLPMFMVLRVINGFASMTVIVVSFVLVVELVSGKWRTIIGILNILPVSFAYTMISGIAYLTQDWRLLQLYISIPSVVLLLTWYCVPESPRWLLAKGNMNQLIKIIERAVKFNNIKLPSNYLKILETACPKDDPNIKTNNNPLLVVLSRKFRKTTFLTLIAWFSMVILYFGLTLHLSNLGGDLYINAAISGIVEAASICVSLFIVLKFGIRKNLIAYMMIAGIACILVNVVPHGNVWGVITLAMIGKCIMGASNAVLPIFTAQQYPTIVRNFGVGVGNLAAGIALLLIPYIWLLQTYQVHLPMTIMGILGLIGSASIIFMKDKGCEE